MPTSSATPADGATPHDLRRSRPGRRNRSDETGRQHVDHEYETAVMRAISLPFFTTTLADTDNHRS
jgi:hypothetical protein